MTSSQPQHSRGRRQPSKALRRLAALGVTVGTAVSGAGVADASGLPQAGGAVTAPSDSSSEASDARNLLDTEYAPKSRIRGSHGATVTGDALTSAVNSALATVPGATIISVKADLDDADGGAYQVTLLDANGNRVKLKMDTAFGVVKQKTPGSNGHKDSNGSSHTVVTGDDADKASAAALAAVPGATVVKVTTADRDGAAFAVHLTDANGAKVKVTLDANFVVLAVKTEGTVVTGDDADKASAAALAAVPGGTVVKVMTDDDDGAAFEVYLTDANGARVKVKLDANFVVLSIKTDDHNGHDGDRPGQTVVTGDDADKASAAALAAVPGGTVVKVTTDDHDGAAFEVYMTLANGAKVKVRLDANFVVLSVKTEGTVVTGDDADKASAAALAAVPGGTVVKVMTDDDDGAAFEVHLTDANGARVKVTLDANFAVLSVKTDDHKGGHDGDRPDGHPGSSSGTIAGTEADKASAAALAAVPGGTVVKVKAEDDDGAAYEVYLTDANGAKVKVKLDANFAVLSVKTEGTSDTIVGADADKAGAAALAAVPGGTVIKVEADDDDGAAYEVYLTDANGAKVKVKLDANFTVLSVETKAPDGKRGRNGHTTSTTTTTTVAN